MVKAAIYRNSKKTYTQDDVQGTIAYYKAGHCSNVSLVADKFGVKRGTPRNCLQGVHGPPTTLNKPSGISLTLRSVCCAIGLNTEAKAAARSVDGFFFARSKKSSERSPLRNGTGGFSKDTLIYDLVNLLALTPNELNASTELQLTSTFENWGRPWTRRINHGAMSTIWTRKGVSEAEAEECRPLSILFHTIDGPTISCVAPTWSWLQPLSVYVCRWDKHITWIYIPWKKISS
jgi:hypothetical protein